MNPSDLAQGVAALQSACPSIPYAPGHQPLLQTLQAIWPQWPYQYVLSRGGWYRPGRLRDASGRLIDEDAQGWIERAWAESGEDGATFLETWREQGLWLSRYEGQTHFLVAPYGPQAGEFLQLEIESLREVSDRPLLDPAHPPAELQDLLEPMPGYARLPHAELSEPHYRFRRLTAMDDFLHRLRGQRPEAPPACRFIEDWERSSAASRRLCEHWVFALSEHLDRFRQPVLSAHPLSLDAGPAMPPADDGLGRARAIQDFDKQRGYPAAWFFHMVAGAGVPKALGLSVGEDLAQGMRYLPDRDADMLADWLDRPYAA